MTDWPSLELQFRELAGPLRNMRLDFQGGAAGEHWGLAGGADMIPMRRFETLAEIAGSALATSPLIEGRAEIVSAATPSRRWYHALKQLSGVYRPGQYFEMGTGIIVTGSIPQIAEASALLCLQAAAAVPPPAMTDVLPAGDILELKPSFYGIRIDLRALWRWLTKAKVQSK